MKENESLFHIVRMDQTMTEQDFGQMKPGNFEKTVADGLSEEMARLSMDERVRIDNDYERRYVQDENMTQIGPRPDHGHYLVGRCGYTWFKIEIIR